VPIVPYFLQETIQKYGVPEIFNTDQGVNTPVIHTNVLLKQWNKNFYGRKDELLTTFFIEDYGGQSNTRMYIYKHMLTESAFRGLKDYFEFYNTQHFINH
jgi:putative transposase